MQLSKHHGLGNDFLIVVDLDGTRGEPGAEAARALCDRRLGVGADGLIHAGPGDGGADATMVLRNADGGRAEMSGNGARCLGQALARARGADRAELTVATDAGRRRITVAPGPDDATSLVEVDMGEAGPGPDTSLSLPPFVTKATTVDMGNPHLVLLVDDPDAVELERLGPEAQAAFPHGINVEVVAVAGEGLTMRVWERGVGITQACGTGACAAAVAASQWGITGDQVEVRMPGGPVAVRLDGDAVSLTGPSVHVADVEVPWL